MKKVLHIVPQFTTGGAEKMILYYGQMLDSAQFEVCAACAVETGELKAQFDAARVPTFVASRSRDGGRFGAYKKLLEFVRSWQPDIVHTHLFGGDLMGFLIKIFVYRRACWVVTLHNVEHNTSWVRKVVWMIILRFADRVITVSPVVDRYAKERFLLSSKTRKRIVNGIPLAPWRETKQTELHAQTEVIHIATIGRLTKQKGHAYLLEALAGLPADVPWILHFYGAGELEHSLQEQAADLGLSHRVVFEGISADLPAQLSTIDIVVQPSLWEGLSLVVMESMAAGKCIITTPAGGAGVIEDGVTGRIVPAKDSAAITQTLMELYVDREACTAMAYAARAYANTHFAMEQNVIAVADEYRLVCP